MEQSVLIIEDNAVTRKMLRLTLESEHYKIWEAGSAQEGLQLTQAHQPSLIVQDLLLPDMDGYELIKRLRALPAATDIPVLCYSGLIGAGELDTVLAAGFTDLVLKPAMPQELLKTINSHLTSPPAPNSGQFSGRHILVVDDDPALRKLSALRLKTAGARVTTAENGNDALAKARAEAPDAILSDVLMPECDGFALCSALRNEPALAAIPLVLVSLQYVDEEDLRLAQQLGANALVMRSADLNAALDALASSLTEAVPVPLASFAQLQTAHLERVMHRLHHKVNEQARQAQAQTLYGVLTGFLEQLANLTASSGELADNLDEVLARYLDACGFPSGALYLFEADGTLVPHALCGVSAAMTEAWRDYFGQAALLRVAMERDAPTVLSGDDPLAEKLLRAADAQCMLLCPLRIDHRPLGVLALCTKRQQLDAEWLILAQAASRPISQAIALAHTLTILSVSEQRFRGLAEALADGIIITDKHGRIEYANTAATTLFGYPADGMRGLNSARLTPLLKPHAASWSGQVQHRDGHPIPINGSTSAVLDPEHPERPNYAHVIHDLSAQEHLEQLRHLANHDVLTQVCNRRAFEDELKSHLKEAERYGVQGAVLLLDLDHFKQINDQLGHAAGDAALVAFAGLLRRGIRETDVPARLGGDEFAIIAPHIQPEQVLQMADKLLRQLAAEPAQYDGAAIPLSASISIALYTAHGTAPETLLAAADRAMYQAKRDGRNCCKLYHQSAGSNRRMRNIN